MGIAEIVFLSALTLGALWTVMTRSLLRAGIGLAFVSAMLAVVMYRLDSELAAVVELSVCAGLIPVIFISTVNLTEAINYQEVRQHMKERLKKFWYLPLIMAAAGIALALLPVKTDMSLVRMTAPEDARILMWNLRRLDIVGQIIILLAGVFGVVVLFKERKKK